ncbi:cycloeucalenol cycloisomerase [Fusarium phyllophilum]|uniref:Cycloeucalenol cycloisomerase n=1 Tax=Fusarium phyllophilum TaxID=47803 RepID=A0A8H5K861_9HYPO|nr:cycloeucalenol cycloisomerase [Fusarium phyllophilum]
MSTSPKKNQISVQYLEADKRWTEGLILAQSPFWVIAVAFVMLSGIINTWNDVDYMLFSITVASPSILLPALLSKPGSRPWYRRYWVKLNLWVSIIVFTGTYFISHYFFDLMGMRYMFNNKVNFSSAVAGRAGGEVPLFLYPLTHAYFMSYFTFLLVAERKIVRRLQPGRVGHVFVVLALSYVVALGETFFMASPLLSEVFLYEKRDRMMKVGTFGYMIFFITGLPMLGRVDSHGEDWPLSRVVTEALAAFACIMLLFELWAKIIGSL